LISAADSFTSDAVADEIDEFFKTHKAPGAERSIKQTVEKIRGNAKWMQRDESSIRAWLEEHTAKHPHVQCVA